MVRKSQKKKVTLGKKVKIKAKQFIKVKKVAKKVPKGQRKVNKKCTKIKS